MDIEKLKKLSKQWEERKASYTKDETDYGEGYKDALSECIHDLKDTISYLDLEEHYNDLQADDYLSTIEAHELFSNY